MQKHLLRRSAMTYVKNKITIIPEVIEHKNEHNGAHEKQKKYPKQSSIQNNNNIEVSKDKLTLMTAV